MAGGLMLLILTLMVAGLAVVAGAQHTTLEIPMNELAFWLALGGSAFLASLSIVGTLFICWKFRKLVWED